MAASTTVVVRPGASVVFSDGSGTPKTLEVYPTVGDLSWSETVTITEYMHRGAPMADGEGILPGDQQYVEITLGYALHDLTDAVKTDALVRWLQGDTTTTTAIAAASWTSTTTRADGRNTLDVVYYPHGTASGNMKYVFPDCLVTTKQISEGDPTLVALTLKSTTAAKPIASIIT